MSAFQHLHGPKSRWGILCVVGKEHINHEQLLFDAFRDNNIKNIGFLPCVVQNDGQVDWNITISSKEYADFLMRIFDIWTHSDVHGMSIRNFDDAIRHFRGYPSSTSIGKNICNRYLTVSPDGTLYLCDNFSLNQRNKVGHVADEFEKVDDSDAMKWIVQAMQDVPEGCSKCQYFDGCYGGCKYYRWIEDPTLQHRQYYCLSTRLLYSHVGEALATGE